MTETPTTWPDLSAHGLALWLADTDEGRLIVLSGETIGMDGAALERAGLLPVPGRTGLHASPTAPGTASPVAGQAAMAAAFPRARTVPYSHGLHYLSTSGKAPARLSIPDTSALRPGSVATWQSASQALGRGHAPSRGQAGTRHVLGGHVRAGGRLHEVLVQEVDGDMRILLGNALPATALHRDRWSCATLLGVEAARAASPDLALASFAGGLWRMAAGGCEDAWGKAAAVAAGMSGREEGDLVSFDCGGADAVLSRTSDGFSLSLAGDVGRVTVGPTWNAVGLLGAADVLTSNKEWNLAPIRSESMLAQAGEAVRRAACGRR